MPSRNLYDALSPMPHLSTIIKLEPEEEPWCAGYAPSQGRRCKARTNAQCRYCAMLLLDDGTEDLQRGRCIDDVLEELAPHVLCRGFHQNQAPDLVRRWKRRVSSFIESQSSSTTSRTAHHGDSGPRHNVGSEQTIEQRLARLEHGLKDVAENLMMQLSAGSSAAALVSYVNDLTRELDRETSSFASGTATDDSVHISRFTETSVQSPSRNQSDSTTRQIQRDAMDYSPIGESPVLLSQSHRVSSSIPATNVIRRPVEGDCGICLCTLQEPQSYTTDEESDHESNEDSDEDSDEESDEESDGDSDEDSDEESEEDEDEEESDDEDQESDEESEEDEDGDHRGYHSNDDHSVSIVPENTRLVWCKAKCGVNYHEECIDRWLESGDYTSCPTCRSDWRH